MQTCMNITICFADKSGQNSQISPYNNTDKLGNTKASSPSTTPPAATHGRTITALTPNKHNSTTTASNGNSYTSPMHSISNQSTTPTSSSTNHSALNLATPDSSPLLTSPASSSIGSAGSSHGGIFSSPSPPGPTPVKMEPLESPYSAMHRGYSSSVHGSQSYAHMNHVTGSMSALSNSGVVGQTAVGAN